MIVGDAVNGMTIVQEPHFELPVDTLVPVEGE